MKEYLIIILITLLCKFMLKFDNLRTILSFLLITLLYFLIFGSKNSDLIHYVNNLPIMINIKSNKNSNSNKIYSNKNVYNLKKNEELNNLIDKSNEEDVNGFEWTSDKLIKLDNYNQNDCTNDGSCIIKPDNKNLFTKPIDYKVDKNLICNKEYNDNINNKYCMICRKYIDPINYVVTETFTNIDPYRSEGDFRSSNTIIRNRKIDKILNKILENKQNNKSNTNIDLNEIKKLSNNICHHCKIGLCVNDGCYSI